VIKEKKENDKKMAKEYGDQKKKYGQRKVREGDEYG
jgi:hypothetical protein